MPLQVTIARACQVAFTGLLCLLIVIGLLPVCVLRATMGPGVGIFSNLGFGITIIQAQFAWQPTHGYQLLWKDVSPSTTGASFQRRWQTCLVQKIICKRLHFRKSCKHSPVVLFYGIHLVTYTL